MTNGDLESLKTLIIHKLDILEFLDILGIELDELVEYLEENVAEEADALWEAVS